MCALSDSPDTVTLREFLDSMCAERMRQHSALVHHCEDRLTAFERAVAEKFEWVEKSTSSTAAQLDRRLEGMNEFRDSLRELTAKLATRDEMETLKGQIGKLFSRTEHEAFMKIVDADLRDLREFKSELKGKASQSHLVIAFLLGLLGAISGLVSILREIVR